MVQLICDVKIKSELCIEDVAEIISAHLLGGVRFEGKGNYVRDEIPAIYSSEYVLGCRFLLSGEPDEEGYCLEVWSHKKRKEFADPEAQKSFVDISEDIVELLKSVGSIQASLR